MATATKLLTPPQVAERLAVTVDTLRVWRWAGRGPRYVKVQRAVRYNEADIERYIRENTRTTTEVE